MKNITIEKVVVRENGLFQELLVIWETSVRATHFFLTEEDIPKLRTQVKAALAVIDTLIVAKDDSYKPIAFMGIQDGKLEMLFISSENRGDGVGKTLISYGIKEYHVESLDVNEQNPQALGFYEHMGFEVYERSEFDEQGNHFPILHMRLKR
ncbi:putative acetyltransferase [Fontibacillus panacisegetis]|uniref:Putative acetyltransferase n=1 Tax=Fontibacillus panacisegetis TaxID=670482 RepID=A0A1G7QG08_9BACL|nr:GNAT family N-acetyltransferase [Fontibacillus panacisegetis]SDF97436.1 putative acetyltransferase [Fontibacillus panacisegetis]